MLLISFPFFSSRLGNFLERNYISLSHGTIDPRFSCKLRRNKVSFFDNFLFEANRSSSIGAATEAGNEKGNCIGTFTVLIYDLCGCGDSFFFSGNRTRGSARLCERGALAEAIRRRGALSCPREMRYEGENVYSRFPHFVPRRARKGGGSFP